MLSSPRRPDITIWIFSSGEFSLGVARRMALTTCSAGNPVVTGFFLISTSMLGQDEPQTLRYAIRPNCSVGADDGQTRHADKRNAEYRRPISPAGGLILVSGMLDRLVRVFDADTGAELCEVTLPLHRVRLGVILCSRWRVVPRSPRDMLWSAGVASSLCRILQKLCGVPAASVKGDSVRTA
jgi:hypothetical protein